MNPTHFLKFLKDNIYTLKVNYYILIYAILYQKPQNLIRTNHTITIDVIILNVNQNYFFIQFTYNHYKIYNFYYKMHYEQ